VVEVDPEVDVLVPEVDDFVVVIVESVLEVFDEVFDEVVVE